jgi:hypothetical protein
MDGLDPIGCRALAMIVAHLTALDPMWGVPKKRMIFVWSTISAKSSFLRACINAYNCQPFPPSSTNLAIATFIMTILREMQSRVLWTNLFDDQASIAGSDEDKAAFSLL